MRRCRIRSPQRSSSSANDVAAAHDAADEMRQRLDIEKKRLEEMEASEKQQIDLQQQQIEGLKAILNEQKNRVAVDARDVARRRACFRRSAIRRSSWGST